jgi:hypothetical protein
MLRTYILPTSVLSYFMRICGAYLVRMRPLPSEWDLTEERIPDGEC